MKAQGNHAAGLPETRGSIGKHDWCIGKWTEDGFAVFVDDRQLSYRKSHDEAVAYAKDIIARLIADGDYRLNDKPSGFLPPAIKPTEQMFVTDRIQVGTEVGARRWPYAAAHPGCWGTPWKGVVLAMNDPRAWAGNAALSTQEKIDAHVAWCHEHGLLHDSVPVLWDFGCESVVYFQATGGDARCYAVRPYADDYHAWESERAEAFRRLEEKEKAALIA